MYFIAWLRPSLIIYLPTLTHYGEINFTHQGQFLTPYSQIRTNRSLDMTNSENSIQKGFKWLLCVLFCVPMKSKHAKIFVLLVASEVLKRLRNISGHFRQRSEVFESSEILGSHEDVSGDPGQSHTFDSEQIQGNSRASIPEKLHHWRRSKKWFTWHVISIIAENKPHAHHKSHLHTMKVYNTRPSQFC